MGELLFPGKQWPTTLNLVPWSELDSRNPIDYHVHTDFTDGSASIKEMAEAAYKVGIREVLFSEHVRNTSSYFPGFVAQVKTFSIDGFKAYVGAEAKIVSSDGTLDCTQDVAFICNAIIGSVHRPPNDQNKEPQKWSSMSLEKAIELEYQLSMAIIKRSRAHILGHPMGMTFIHFGITPIRQLERLANACRVYDKAFELNSRYCSDTKIWIDIVKHAECKISCGSDAHNTSTVGSAWDSFITKGK